MNCLRHTLPYDISVSFSKAAISPYTLTRTLSCPRYARQPTLGPVDNRINFRRSVSTQPMYATSQGVDYHAMALAQDSDDDITHLRNDPATSLRLENVRLNSTTSLLCDTSTGVQRPVVPELFRRRVFDTVHGLSHPGIRTTRRLLTSKFVWPRIAADAASLVSVMCMLMLSGPYHRLKDSRISSPSSTYSRGGRKPFR